MDLKLRQMKNKLPYLDFIEQELRLSPNQQKKPLVIDLFAGCGGMALGFEAAGFQTVGYEILEDANNVPAWYVTFFLHTADKTEQMYYNISRFDRARQFSGKKLIPCSAFVFPIKYKWAF